MLLLQQHIRNVRRAPRLRLIASYYTTGAGPLNILFFGRDDFSCKTLEQLWSARDVWRSIHLVTTEDEHIGRGRKTLSVSPLKTMGQSLQIPIHEVSKDDVSLQKLPPQFSQPGPNNVLVSASYGRAVPNSILYNFEHRLNVHPSLIPKYRGAAPIQWTIANGDETTGVSIIRMEDVSQGFDTGDIYASKAMEVPTDATYPVIAPILAAEGGHLLADVLRKLIKKEQSNRPPEYPKIIHKHQKPDWYARACLR
ncbi:Methionyl-tRNA formyltransferase [Tulasnella sp. 425]|nr:Methionyl-tRNA formyltransferase [Tulasnella sp. 425]